MQVSAKGISQQKVTFSDKNAPLEKVLREIRKQSGYDILYSDRTMSFAHPVSVNMRNASLEEALHICLKDQPLTYTIVNKTVLIEYKRPVTRPAQVIPPVTVSGLVTDTLGRPLIGVSVHVKGSQIGTITDENGKFTLSVNDEQALLEFTYSGYIPEERPVGSNKVFNIVLKYANTGLNEVVVVGYGTQKKVNLTGAISSLKGSEITTTKNENVVNMLAGKIPGVRVIQTSGEPGDFASSIQIRGMGAPLVIIDGVPRDNISRLNPNEIESVSVLKDASAAIYGVRAANGVILITTKKGERGKMQLEYSGYYGVQTPINTPKGLNAAEYMEITNENNIMRGSVPFGTLIFPLSVIEEYKSGKRQGTEWWRINSNYYAPQYQQNISATGGNEIINYFVNFGNLKQQGIYKSGDLNYERSDIRSNISAKINKSLRVELLLNGMIDTKNSPYGADNREQYWRTVWVLKPTDPAYANYNRDYMQEILQGLNPLATTRSDIYGYEKANQKFIQSTANIIWDVPWVKGLQAKGAYAYDYTFWENKSLQKPYQLYQYDLSNDEYRPSTHGNTTMPGSSAITRSTRFSANTLLQGSLNYENTFGNKHHVGGLVLYEEGTTNMDNFAARRYILMTSIEELLGGVSENQEGWMDGSGYNSGASVSGQSGFWKIANKALVGRASYDFASKYFAEFSFRYDGSSKFAKGHQWGFFPSVSAGWRLSEESFVKDNSALSFIDNLKLRASYGVLGDDGTATFQFVPGYTYPVDNFGWPVRVFDSRAAGIALKGEPNPNLTWMTSKLYDIGLDADLWNGLLGFEFDLFKRDRSGLVGSRVTTIPDWLGQGLAGENLNRDATYGFDLSLRHRNVLATGIGDLQYGIAANIGASRSKTVYQERKEDVDQYANWRNNPTNRPKDIWWGVESLGQFQNYDEIFSAPIIDGQGNANLKPGDYRYQDWNGDGVIDGWDDHPITSGANAQNTPIVYYGFTLDAGFKGFDLTAVFQGGMLSNVMYSEFLARPFSYDGNGPDFFYDRWHMKNPTDDPRDPRTVWVPGTYPTTSQASPAMFANAKSSTASIFPAGYLRCKSLELGYTVPKNIIDKIKIQGLRVYVTAYNLLTFTKLKYTDPEHPSNDHDLLYPLIRTINFGGTIRF
ncbi:TonB-dependent receptor [Compostibacter hankyongensis]|uniref:TonB-dependent receptor n=2 Tax=Compostibacter hankyongensis TaxID=1007089 RepID=A0ABP8FXB5_9BACT